MSKQLTRSQLNEIVGAMIILCVISLLAAFFYLKTPLKHNLTARALYRQTEQTLSQKTVAVQAENKTAELLMQWKKKDAALYNALQSTTTFDQQLQNITQLLAQSQFQLIQINPILPEKSERSLSAENNHLISLQATGHFLDLFSFITKLNQMALPVTITQLTIDHSNHLTMQLQLRGSSD